MNKNLRVAMERKRIPVRMWDSIENYIVEGDHNVGHFVKAIITNDLTEAVAHADSENLALLPNYVKFFYNEAPLNCWGSEEAFQNWTGIK
jgi:hypothetical protein